MPQHDAALDRIVALFASLTRDDVARLGEFYAADARFRDPFNEVRGVAAIGRVFTHMFDTLDAPRFAVRDVVRDGERVFLSWDFGFALRAGAQRQTIHGGSLLTLGSDARIVSHIDYWDASELFATLPLLAGVVRWLKRRASG